MEGQRNLCETIFLQQRKSLNEDKSVMQPQAEKCGSRFYSVLWVLSSIAKKNERDEAAICP